MLSYEHLASELQQAWTSTGLHEHALVETLQPDTLERSYRAELFPEHEEPLTEENVPPWVEIGFSWMASHQLRSENYHIDPDPLGLVWNYMLFVPARLHEYPDSRLVRMFQNAVQNVLGRYYPDSIEEPHRVAVEIRRVYQGGSQRLKLAYMQLVSTNITDLSELWNNPEMLSHLLHGEMEFANAVIQALADTFHSGDSGGYRSVDTA